MVCYPGTFLIMAEIFLTFWLEINLDYFYASENLIHENQISCLVTTIRAGL